MWKRLQTLWGGRNFGELVDGEEDASAASPVVDVAPTPLAESSAMPQPDDHRAAAIVSVRDHLAAEDLGSALREVRELLVSEPMPHEALELAADLMGRVGEDPLADLFQRAAADASSAPLLELSAAFLRMTDVPMALAMATAAGDRSGVDTGAVNGLKAEALARDGRHAEVIRLLEAWPGTVEEPMLVRRLAASALVAGALESYERLADQIGQDPEAAWLVRAAERARRWSEGSGHVHRDALFCLSGACLLAPGERPRQGPLSAAEIHLVMTAACEVLRAQSTLPDRFAYLSNRGEVFAQWLADELGAVAIPLGALHAGQTALLVVPDSREMSEVALQGGALGPGVGVFQVLMDARSLGLPVADLIGYLTLDAELPLEALDPVRTADRLPPRILMETLRDEGLVGSGVMDELPAWVEARSDGLSLLSPAPISERTLYRGDLPTWRPPEEPTLPEPEPAETSGPGHSVENPAAEDVAGTVEAVEANNEASLEEGLDEGDVSDEEAELAELEELAEQEALEASATAEQEDSAGGAVLAGEGPVVVGEVVDDGPEEDAAALRQIEIPFED